MAQARALARAEKVELAAGPTVVTLEVRGGVSRISALGSRRLHLVLRGLGADEPPGVLYHVYLNLPPEVTPVDSDFRHAGIVNFYGAPAGDAVDPDRIYYSFDVTAAVHTLRADDQFRDSLTVTFYPVGRPTPEAKAVVSLVELVEQVQ